MLSRLKSNSCFSVSISAEIDKETEDLVPQIMCLGFKFAANLRQKFRKTSECYVAVSLPLSLSLFHIETSNSFNSLESMT